MISLETLEVKRKELQSQFEQAIANSNAIKGALQLADHLIGLAQAELSKVDASVKKEQENLSGK